MKGNDKSRDNPIAFEVEIKRLDDVLEDEELSRMKLMLFDVEGAEHSVLKGAINTIVDNRVPNIIAEINNGALNACLSSQMELRSYMGLYGYKTYFVNENDITFIPPTEDIHLKVSSDGEVNVENVFNVLFKHLTAE
jgi:restriction endonuclease S subunit